MSVKEEERERFLRHVWSIIEEWDQTQKPTTREQLSGLAFTILSLLDGGFVTNKGYCVTPIGKDAWPMRGIDIAGELHEHFYKYDPRRAR